MKRCCRSIFCGATWRQFMCRYTSIVCLGIASFFVMHYFEFQAKFAICCSGKELDVSVDSDFLVKTNVCKIPNIDPFDESIRNLYISASKLKCSDRASLTFQDGEMIRINRTAIQIHYKDGIKNCVYQPIFRPNVASDFKYMYRDNKTWFRTDVRVLHEYVRVFCYNRNGKVVYVNFHAFVLPRASLIKKKKIKFTKTKMQNIKEKLNVVMLGIDSMSRLNFMRQMNKTREFLVKHLGVFEMTGYNKVADNTLVNIVPMTTGKYLEELPWNESMNHLPFDRYSFIWNNFSENGYITLYAEDSPKMNGFNYLNVGFYTPPADYYIRPFAMAMENEDVWNSGHNCVHDRSEVEIYLNYLKDFTNVHKWSSYFAFVFMTRISHDSINTIGRVDETYLEFFKRMKTSGNLDNTLLLFYSDHGIRFGRIRGTYVGKLEERLPFMFLSFPPWFRDRYPKLAENLAINQQRLTTPFDIHETLLDVLRFDGQDRPANVSHRGISLFREVPEDRSCDHASILPHWCTCLQQEKMDTRNEAIVKAANFLNEAINSKTEKYRRLCALLKVGRVLNAVKIIPSEKVLRFKDSVNYVINRKVVYGQKVSALIDYQLQLETIPGEARFEATIRYHERDRKFSILGSISRISMYGMQSRCVSVLELKRFCYCHR